MYVTFMTDGVLRKSPLSGLQFPLHITGEQPCGTSAPAAPILRLSRHADIGGELRSGVAVVAPAIFVTSSSRTVEVHVQTISDTQLSYAQTLRGTPCSPEAIASTRVTAAVVPSGQQAGGTAFTVRVPLGQAYPDWRRVQLRFSSARSAVVATGGGSGASCDGGGGPLCCVYDIQLEQLLQAPFRDGSAARPAASPSMPPPDFQAQARERGLGLPATSDDGACLRTDSAAVASALAAPCRSIVLQPPVEAGGSEVLAVSPQLSGETEGHPSSDHAAGGGSGSRDHDGAGPASGSQMQQLRSLLQLAASRVPPPTPAAQHGALATAAGGDPAATAGRARLDPGVPSAARANLGLAAVLARSLLRPHGAPQAQASTAGEDADSTGAAPASAGAVSAQDSVPSVDPGAPTAQLEEAALSTGVPLPLHDQAAALPAGRTDYSATTLSAPAAPPPQFTPLPLPFPAAMASALAQLSDMGTRVRRIEELLHGRPDPVDQRREAAAPMTPQAPAVSPPQHQLLPLQLQEQVLVALASLPSLVSSMGRLEAAVEQQGARLEQLGRQVDGLQRWLEVGVFGLPAEQVDLATQGTQDTGRHAAQADLTTQGTEDTGRHAG